MPKSSADVPHDPLLRMVILGAPRSGKTYTVLTTCPSPAYVIECDGAETAVKEAARAGAVFTYDMVASGAQLEAAVRHAKAEAAAGKLQTVVLDTLSNLAQIIEEEELSKSKEAFRAYPAYGRRLRHLIRTLFALPCHVVITSHFRDPGPGIDGDPKVGRGIFPLLAGDAKESVSALCHDVVFLELLKDGSRRFLANPLGVWGAGSKSVLGTDVAIPPTIPALLEHINRGHAPPTQETKP